MPYRVHLSANIAIRKAKCRSCSDVFKRNFARARSMKTLTHFLDTPKRSEISALLKPLPISLTTCDSRRLNNIGRSSLTGFRLLRFLVMFVNRVQLQDSEVT